MESYILGFIIMFTYSIKEINESKYSFSLIDYIYYFFGLIIWPIVLGILLFEVVKKLNKN